LANYSGKGVWERKHFLLACKQKRGLQFFLPLSSYLGKLPTFDLHFVGRTSLTWWRLYTLRIAGVSCRIKEVFPNGMFTSGWIDSSQTGLTRADIETVENETIWPSSSIEIF